MKKPTIAKLRNWCRKRARDHAPSLGAIRALKALAEIENCLRAIEDQKKAIERLLEYAGRATADSANS